MIATLTIEKQYRHGCSGKRRNANLNTLIHEIFRLICKIAEEYWYNPEFAGQGGREHYNLLSPS